MTEYESRRSNKETERWRMNRVGILNFWYYDEEEFQLEDGRLILRGANGSGKSVTMQSFLPLVLDGDKRPHRLDPFGSRDRRIEYYLLGEEEGGKTDATGYLWMEFYHPGTHAFKTIGIGMRARRNAAQVQFWGFLLEDGRRIGHDFWLYVRNDWIEGEGRIPLSRKELEERIGSGGQVVQDQTSYRELVNKQLFGFAETDAFQDLLQLMIQLRSPKLSKDFKPSAIYEILHQALPPLVEDELRPLSEVLEDMDTLADRLDEIRVYRKELAKLQESYDRYNKHMLYLQSGELLEAKAAHDDFAARAEAANTDLEQAEREKTAALEEKGIIQARIQEIGVERNLLEKHEAIGKQREFESATEALADTEKQLERAQEREQKARLREEKLMREQEQLELRRCAARSRQEDLLGELETMAQELEFAEHPVYHRYWMPDIPIDETWKEAWRRDVFLHRERLERAADKARKEREAAALAREREVELGEASRLRDEAEREHSQMANRFEAAKEALKDEVLIWQKQLRELTFDDEGMRATFAAIREYGPAQGTMDGIRAALQRNYSEVREALAVKRLESERQKNDLLAERERLMEERRGWEQSREPEPPRSEARVKARANAEAGTGAPLYAVCDFQPHITEEMQACIEEALERSGLLDAWISPDGRFGKWTESHEEMWLDPNPVEFGYTLADVLVPSPSEDSGLTSAHIDVVLRTFLWMEEGGALEPGQGEWSAVIAGNGEFRLGPLAGRTSRKERAAYIGKETRKRTRLLEIARLGEAIAAVEEEIRSIQEQIELLQARELVLAGERDAFPDGAELQESMGQLQMASYQLEAAMKQEERALARFKEKSAEWRELQRELAELTSGWSRLKREHELREALALLRDYDGAIGELHSAWRQYNDAVGSLERVEAEMVSVRMELEGEAALTEELGERRRTLRAQVETLRRLIEELGLADVARRLEELRSEEQERAVRLKTVEQTLDLAKDRAARAEGQLGLLNEQVAVLRAQLEETFNGWQRELQRGLVAEWKDRVDDSTAVLAGSQRLAKEMRQQYEPLFAGRNVENVKNNLLELFNAVRMLLTEYILQTVVEENTGRILVVSMRDHARPQPPHALVEELEQMEAEQAALLSEKDRELYEEIILRSVGKAIRQRIHRAEQWVRDMNKLMEERNTSSGLRLKLEWEPKPAMTENQLDTAHLVELLKRDSHRLREDEIDAMILHFRTQIGYAKQNAQEEQESLRRHLYEALDYRNWFRFELKYRKGEQIGYRPLTDARFNVLSGGEKAMAMYIPLFAATWSRYSDARSDAPRLISLDEAFAGVDEENMRDMFKLLTDMGFDYMMTSQVLWGCFDTVPKLAIYEIYRPKDVDFVTLFHYRWNGRVKEYVEGGKNV